MLLNIIHPYTFKIRSNVKGNTLVIGPVKDFKERDEKVSKLIKQVIDSDNRALVQMYHGGNPMEFSMQEAALLADPLYEQVLSLSNAVTTPYGVPIPDKKPENADETTWAYLQKIYSTHSELKEKVGHPDSALFIGGAMEACLYNGLIYYNEHFRNGEKVFYVPELSVCLNQNQFEELKPNLDKLKILALSFEEAMELAGKGRGK